MPKITILRESCKGVNDCGICMFVCPKELYRPSKEMNEAGYIPTDMKDETKCNGCLNCMVYCPDLAIVVEREAGEANPEEED